ncbi:hypothetical protein DIPPA_13401 [Diplonema papillatum]|nr:hypothetical protein DIPPA_13401 [Diplonema papillatum]
MRVRSLLQRHTAPGYTLLWCMLWYWVMVMASHSLWDCRDCVVKSLGVSVIVGCVLNVSAFSTSGVESFQAYVRKVPLGCVRLFIIPYCVASYSAVANVQGENFAYLFPSDGPKPLTYSGIFAIALVSYVAVSLLLHRHLIHVAAAKSPIPDVMRKPTRDGAGGGDIEECGAVKDCGSGHKPDPAAGGEPVHTQSGSPGAGELPLLSAEFA